VEVTHPFHPLSGKRFRLVARWRRWGGDRVLFEDPERGVRSVPTAWTSVAETDPYVAMSAGRSLFRTEDLIALATLVEGLCRADGCKGDSAETVKKTTPSGRNLRGS
jgi:hypothetical protein